AHGAPHQVPERVADVGQVERLVAVADVDGGEGRDFQALGARGAEVTADVFRRAGAVDEALEQAVRGQPVGAVQARAGDLARGPEAGQRRPTLGVDRQAADHVV